MSLLLLAAGCEGQDWPGRPRPPEKPTARDEFNDLYKRHCSGCHGKDGDLGPAPPLNDQLFLAIVPDEELLMVVADGRPGTLMPAWAKRKGGPLSDEQVKVLAAGIKPRWATSAKPEGDIPPYAPDDDKPGGDKAEGAKVFATACANCHGPEGRGGSRGSVNDPAFLALLSDQALRRLVITGRTDLGMPAYDGIAGRTPAFKPLTSKEVGDLVALMAYWRVGGSAEGK